MRVPRSVPQLLVDGTNLYLYGANVSSAPIEQINILRSTSNYLISDNEGVRELIDCAGVVAGNNSYDAYGNCSSCNVTSPFGYGGACSDPTGLKYLINRYCDPSTGQFISVDPLAAVTGQPFAYANDNPVNAIDPNGLDCGFFSFACSAYDATAGGVKTAVVDAGHVVNAALPVIHTLANSIAVVASLCAVVTSETVIGGITCGTIAAAAGGVTAVTGVALYSEGRENGGNTAVDVTGGALGGVSSLFEGFANGARALQEAEFDSGDLWAPVRAWAWGKFASGLSGISRFLSATAFGIGLFGEFGSNCS